MNSTHQVIVVPIVLLPHDNSDSLSLVKIWGYQCVVKTSDWQGITKAAYIPPDNYVDTKLDVFSWLKPNANGLHRVKAMKLRGQLSFGLLVPIPDSFNIGDDVTEYLKVTHYQPQVKTNNKGKLNIFAGMEDSKTPNVFAPKYDLEALKRWGNNIFSEGENVIVTEKIHGENARYVYLDGEMHCGSRERWKAEYPPYKDISLEWLKEKLNNDVKAEEVYKTLQEKTPSKNQWWRVLDTCPKLKIFCEQNPGYIVYGELYGNTDMKYDCINGERKFRAFDIKKPDGEWMNWMDALFLLNMFSVPTVPILNEWNKQTETYKGIPYNFEELCKMAEGKSTLNPNHVREGIVVRSWKEENTDRGFRKVLKCCGEGYYNRKNADDEAQEDETV